MKIKSSIALCFFRKIQKFKKKKKNKEKLCNFGNFVLDNAVNSQFALLYIGKPFATYTGEIFWCHQSTNRQAFTGGGGGVRKRRREHLQQKPRLLHFAPYLIIPAVTSTTNQNRALAFLHDWLYAGMYRQRWFRSCRASQNLHNRMPAPWLLQKLVKKDWNPV